MGLNLLRKFTKYYAPLTLRLESDYFLLLRHKNDLRYFLRYLSLDRFIENEVFRDNIYKLKCQPGDKVIDGGAHIGLFTLKCLKEGAFVTAFEPVEKNIELFDINTSLNNSFLGKYSLVKKALWNSNDEQIFFYTNNSGNGSLTPYSHYSAAKKVDCTRLEEYLPCDVLKLDIEGGEYIVLADLDFTKVKREICLEYHKNSGSLLDIANILNRSGVKWKIDFNKDYSLSGYMHITRV